MARRAERFRRALAALVGTLLALFACVAAPAAAAPGGGTPGPAKAPGARSKAPAPKGAAQRAGARAPGGLGLGSARAGSRTTELGASGQVDPISGLGIRNPVCDRPGQIHSRRTRLSCRLSGTPESNYPASNYGFDVWIDTGVDAPSGTFAKGLVMLLNGIWLGLIFVLKLVLALLGLAFGLNPFGDGETMRRIAAAIGRVYRHLTDPWLSALIVCGGIWFAYKGLVRRQLAAGVAGTLAGVALLIVGLWVVHDPKASVGRVARLSDRLALAAIAAPQTGSASRPAGSYAEAMSRTWSGLVEVPFAGLDFSDVQWALGPPPREAVERADQKFCSDVGALAQLSVLARYGEKDAADACAGYARRRYGEPKRVIDLYLRSSPGSPARRELWRYFDKDEADKYKAKVAAQGGDGVLTRLSMLALFACGLLGAILLLAWLAIRLFTQASIGFVLILVAPFALFFPLLGDSGRRAFKTWGLTLLGALVAKVIYAAFLSVVLLGMAILGHVGGAMGFLLSCAFAWSVFLRRDDLVGWLSIGGEAGDRGGVVGKIAALGAARSVGHALGGAAKGVVASGRQAASTRIAEGATATRQTARDSLRGSARALAEQRHAEATRTVTAYEARHGGPPPQSGSERARPERAAPAAPAAPVAPASTGSAAGEGTRRVGPKRGETGRSGPQRPQPEADPERVRYEAAREFLRRTQRNEQSPAGRFSEADLARFESADAELLRTSRDPADHAHRIGMRRARFESLHGAERQRAEEQIEAARVRDRRRLEVADAAPGRVVGRGRQALEGARQRLDGEAEARRGHLGGLRRERRSRRLPRRGVSRGA